MTTPRLTVLVRSYQLPSIICCGIFSSWELTKKGLCAMTRLRQLKLYVFVGPPAAILLPGLPRSLTGPVDNLHGSEVDVPQQRRSYRHLPPFTIPTTQPAGTGG
ncbi:hypothetical protein CVT25_014675 [Psilocybe cyanescens]|uniref:Uncharacterized protein n=1 Tax=Psilocybe cyanescens TaxID=93625 RepID=A0A409X8Q7_PSICY|nr:hypothetical protein CVT25_014675 [Psilocybe cyanescens]